MLSTLIYFTILEEDSCNVKLTYQNRPCAHVGITRRLHSVRSLDMHYSKTAPKLLYTKEPQSPQWPPWAQESGCCREV